MSAEVIVVLAVRLADEGGLKRVTMRRLASELSVTPMALYWHFADKDALIQAMAEHVVSDIVVVDSSDAPWPDRLRSILASTLPVLIAHPWLGHLRRRVIPTPNYLRIIETLLEVMQSAGYDDRRAVIAVDTVLDGVALLAGRIGDVPVLPAQGAGPDPSPREQLRALGPAGYPRLAAAAEALTSGDGPEAADLLIEILVRGVEAAAPGSRH